MSSTTIDVDAVARELEGAPAQEVLGWAVATIPRFAVTSSFGADSAVLLHVVAQVDPSLPVLFLETGLHFAETLRYRDELSSLLGLTNVVDVRPALSVTDQAEQHGPGLYHRDPDRCCAIRKVAPLDAALDGYDGWATGVRRSQTADRAATPVVARVRSGSRDVVKVAPLATWSAADVARYRREHALPPHPLVARGFGSIGCAPCTAPVAEGDDPRAGRWAGHVKTECGIHLDPS